MKSNAIVAAATVIGAAVLAFAGGANAGSKWKVTGTFNVPAGQLDQFLHVPCPTGLIAVSGGFLPNAAAKPGMLVLGNGPRVDESPPDFSEWSWIFDWPSGAPSGSQIRYAVYCNKN